MDAINLRSVDLNLLVVLDALLDEAHVTRAATRVGLTQSAASNALDRCRQMFGDELLLRTGASMRLTPLAEILKPRLRTAIAELRVVLEPTRVDLATLQRTLRLVMADVPAVDVALELHRSLAASAPRLTVVMQPWRGSEAALEGLRRGDTDLAVSIFPTADSDIRRERLFEERYVVAMRRGHPAAAAFDLDEWLAWPHLLVSGRGHTRGVLDEAFALLGRTRQVGVVVAGFALVPPLLAHSDLIALTPSRVVADTIYALETRTPPISIPGFPLHLAWHRRHEGDAAVRHVADVIRRLLRVEPGAA